MVFINSRTRTDGSGIIIPYIYYLGEVPVLTVRGERCNGRPVLCWIFYLSSFPSNKHKPLKLKPPSRHKPSVIMGDEVDSAFETGFVTNSKKTYETLEFADPFSLYDKEAPDVLVTFGIGR